MNQNTGEIVLYQPDSTLQLEVKLKNETVWLSRQQIAVLFGVDRTVISRHLKNIFQTRELDEIGTCAKIAHVGNDGKQTYSTTFYSLDAILSVGYRVNSFNATQFRKWANGVLKDYILRGYAINQRFERIENRLADHDKKIDFFVKTALPPAEGIFFDGQIFDAYKFVSDLVKSAKTSIVLIDNYVDDSVLMLLSKRNNGATATIYTVAMKPELQLDLARHNAQYQPITINTFSKSHDRFLLIDDVVYHIGASLKDLGKKWFAFSKMELKARDLLKNIN
jgi:hypothetical protein